MAGTVYLIEMDLEFQAPTDWERRIHAAVGTWGSISTSPAHTRPRLRGRKLSFQLRPRKDDPRDRRRVSGDVERAVLAALQPPPNTPENAVLTTTEPLSIDLGTAPPKHFRDFVQAAAARHGLEAFQVFATPRGVGGFGYDPYVVVPELGKTVAELSNDEKHARSHRGQALRDFVAWLKS